jgi:hypothetical protein
MSDRSITLETVSEVRPDADAHIRANKLPIMAGGDEGNLNCGQCGEAIATGTSLATFHQKIQTEQRLLIECTCGALNVVPVAQD